MYVTTCASVGSTRSVVATPMAAEMDALMMAMPPKMVNVLFLPDASKNKLVFAELVACF